ncbi:MAG: histidine phosphatase family protein [Bdellovibrionaceae bacterium]|nr:histidine phosphatase family protein [Pseudobdellovibrionaceae bacterium]MBX3034247.1 histidine phosphatase family protein [Pseudobdellovibrionaceae bacterium]
MDLILLRHAEKTLSPDRNPGLTTRGREQAIALISEMQKKRWPKPQRLYASPKARTQQTLQPLSDKLGLKVEILEDLDERRFDESASHFRARIARTIEALSHSELGTGCVLLCSHLDWIEEFRGVIDSEQNLLAPPYDQWSTAQYMILHGDDLWKVTAFGRAL